MAQRQGTCLKKHMDIAVLRDENERLKGQMAQTHAALAESEEARRRLESIIVDMRRVSDHEGGSHIRAVAALSPAPTRSGFP